MSISRETNYQKTDFNFETARSVIGGVRFVLALLAALGTIVGIGLMLQKDGVAAGLVTTVACAIASLLILVGYFFLIGFFELIKHAREIRNELAALRAKSGASTPVPIEAGQPAASAGATRYDSATHQYVKA